MEMESGVVEKMKESAGEQEMEIVIGAEVEIETRNAFEIDDRSWECHPLHGRDAELRYNQEWKPVWLHPAT